MAGTPWTGTPWIGPRVTGLMGFLFLLVPEESMRSWRVPSCMRRTLGTLPAMGTTATTARLHNMTRCDTSVTGEVKKYHHERCMYFYRSIFQLTNPLQLVYKALFKRNSQPLSHPPLALADRHQVFSLAPSLRVHFSLASASTWA